MRYLIYILALAFSFQMSAQDPILQTDNEQIEARAVIITDKYDAQIEMDAKQTILFQKKVEEFLIREHKIKAQFKGKEQLDKLYNLRQAETMEMRNILTHPQFDLYVQLKPTIQPLGRVEKQ
ncbi:MAG: hypothetical protein HKN40_02445 [Winogradskyella sp.]|uniref:hypothetical protein n=1 Tax=Winogradskyella sp. TaxID=1883156 RepID=UPI0017C85D1E|nr:hypothetical protein [Winogradskyella sp.]